MRWPIPQPCIGVRDSVLRTSRSREPRRASFCARMVTVVRSRVRSCSHLEDAGRVSSRQEKKWVDLLTAREEITSSRQLQELSEMRCSFRIATAAALVAGLPFARSGAQSVPKDVAAARVDSMARAYMAAKGPASMSVAITRGSDTLILRAWGLADVAANRPVTTASMYQIGSVTKQFTAVLLLKQVERGTLALTDSIGRYLTTGLRPEWRSLKIEQLLNHTAGMQNDLKRE